MRWGPGEGVAWREACRGREYIAIPERVVEDSDAVPAVCVYEGTRYAFPELWPFGERHAGAERSGFDGILIAYAERVLAEWPFPNGWEDRAPDPLRAVPELPDA